ncbi:DUF6030 family protein [Flexibacterium corallicola]|uniref:DUF6030 family protein n=1 Tax=Flexibacterium corallicola TaxID=3037259 RepID=UPI00286F5C07|nr:DUF6030 family protein [Pseudovibrio sp. M1P-2-3]
MLAGKGGHGRTGHHNVPSRWRMLVGRRGFKLQQVLPLVIIGAVLWELYPTVVAFDWKGFWHGAQSILWGVKEPAFEGSIEDTPPDILGQLFDRDANNQLGHVFWPNMNPAHICSFFAQAGFTNAGWSPAPFQDGAFECASDLIVLSKENNRKTERDDISSSLKDSGATLFFSARGSEEGLIDSLRFQLYGYDPRALDLGLKLIEATLVDAREKYNWPMPERGFFSLEQRERNAFKSQVLSVFFVPSLSVISQVANNSPLKDEKAIQDTAQNGSGLNIVVKFNHPPSFSGPIYSAASFSKPKLTATHVSHTDLAGQEPEHLLQSRLPQ